MRRFGWIVMAALAGMAGGCADDNALYRDPKYVPGYKPPGSLSAALAYEREHEHDRNQRYDWRER
jgi:hypothetical protein